MRGTCCRCRIGAPMLLLAATAWVAASGCAGPLPPSPPPTTSPAQNSLFPVFTSQVADDPRYGYIDRTGRLVVPMTLGSAHSFSEGRAVVWRDREHAAYIDASGQIAFELPPHCAHAEPFSDGLAWINIGGRFEVDGVAGGRWGCVDRTGRFTIEPKFTSGGDPPIADFTEGLAAVRVNDHFWGFVDRAGSFQIEPRFDDVQVFSEGFAAAKVGGKWGFIDRAGAWAIQPRYQDVLPFNEGVAPVREDDAWRFVDRAGKTAIALPRGAETPRSFSGGLACVQLHRTGRVPAGTLCPICNHAMDGRNYGDRCPDCGDVFDGPRRYGYIDHSGKVAILPQFDDARPFREGLAAVAVGEGEQARWGFIDRAGKLVILPRFVERPSAFENGIAHVRIEDPARGFTQKEPGEAYIDPKGRAVWTEESRESRPQSD